MPNHHTLKNLTPTKKQHCQEFAIISNEKSSAKKKLPRQQQQPTSDSLTHNAVKTEDWIFTEIPRNSERHDVLCGYECLQDQMGNTVVERWAQCKKKHNLLPAISVPEIQLQLLMIKDSHHQYIFIEVTK